MSHRITITACSMAMFVAGAALCAEPVAPGSSQPETGATDAIGYRVEVDTMARLFRRQSYPDPSGTLVAGDVALPLYHHALLSVEDVDVPWRKDSVDVELAAWGNLELGEASEVSRLDGDVQVARVRQRFRHAWVSLGRQLRAGGAARFARFDGAAAGARAPGGIGLDAYGGLTVLPRWDRREGYHLLGSAADALLRDPAALPEPDRDGNWLAGGRVFVERPGLVVTGASFHEQVESDALGRRNAALDMRITPGDAIAWSGQAVIDVDAASLADARVSLDAYPTRTLSLGTSYQRLVPALLLSRQSVLGVFSTDAFDEWSVEGDLRTPHWLGVGAFGAVQRFEGGDLGGRGGGNVRLIGGGSLRTTVSTGYRRVVETENGYHAVRASVSVSPVPPATITADGSAYFYDETIADLSSSIVGAIGAAWRLDRSFEVSLASSLARSPYARLDAQGIARLRIALQGGER